MHINIPLFCCRRRSAFETRDKRFFTFVLAGFLRGKVVVFCQLSSRSSSLRLASASHRTMGAAVVRSAVTYRRSARQTMSSTPETSTSARMASTAGENADTESLPEQKSEIIVSNFTLTLLFLYYRISCCYFII